MIDKDIITQARTTDIIIFLEMYAGLTFTGRGGAYRCRQHPSLAVKSDRLSWYWHSKGEGGFGAVDYLMKIKNMTFREAVETINPLCSVEYRPPPTRPAAPSLPTIPPKTLTLPERAGISIRLFDYLCIKRGIDNYIVNRLMDEGKIYQDVRGNVVFVGFDGQGKAKFATLRGTSGGCAFRMDCAGSDKRYGFIIGNSQSERLYIFESAIDAMSHASLVNAETGDKTAWLWHNRLSLAGKTDTALLKYLELNPHTRELVFCLDNDPPGYEAATIMARKYADKGYSTRIELPTGKDFNEDLIMFLTNIPSRTRTKTQQL